MGRRAIIVGETWSALFIEHLKQFPMLFDKRNAFYTNTAITNKAWSVLGSQFKKTDQEIQAHWKALKLHWMKLRKEDSKTPSGSEARTITWPLYKQMTYFDLFIEKRAARKVKAVPEDKIISGSADLPLAPDSSQYVYVLNSDEFQEEAPSPIDESLSWVPSLTHGTCKAQTGKEEGIFSLPCSSEVDNATTPITSKRGISESLGEPAQKRKRSNSSSSEEPPENTSTQLYGAVEQPLTAPQPQESLVAQGFLTVLQGLFEKMPDSEIVAQCSPFIMQLQERIARGFD